MTAEKLEPGWYWVKWVAESDWRPAEWITETCFPLHWWTFYEGRPTFDRQPAIIGPRIEPPAG